jgi:hypothetical protein
MRLREPGRTQLAEVDHRGREVGHWYDFFIHQLYHYIRRLTDEYTWSMVETILVGFGIEKYSTIIFIGIEECKKTKRYSALL